MNPNRRHILRFAAGACWAMASLVPALFARSAPSAIGHLPTLGPAPHFALESASGPRVTLADLRGRVSLITFVFTGCSASCPILIAKLADVGRALGSAFATQYAFVAISVDPLNDTPARLRTYAAAFGVDIPGWYFLTGTPKTIDEVVRRYGVYSKSADNGEVDHLFLTSLIDRAGMLRVQYLGTVFDPREMQRDLQALARE